MPNRSTQVITLKPGEQFILPPNADITYVSDIAAFTSDCEFSLNWNERCYRIAYENQPNAPVQDAIFISYIIDGSEFLFDGDDLSRAYISSFLDELIADVVPLGLFTHIINCSSGSNPRIVFKSIGEEIYVKVRNPTGHDSVGGPETFFYLKAEEITPCDCTGDIGDGASSEA